MKKFLFAVVGILVYLNFLTPVFAYTVDGLVTDWGVSLSAPGADALGYLNTNVPTTGARYVTDDDDWVGGAKDVYVNPGYSGQNRGDAEAAYLDNDANYLYFAVITGTPRDWSGYSPYNWHGAHGDIFFSTDANPNNYEFGVKLDYGASAGGPYSGSLYSILTTIKSDPQFGTEHQSADPWIIGTGNLLTDPNFQFFSSDVQNSHYVLEGRISLAALGLDASNAANAQLHWTMECGNDVLNTAAATPEPATLSLLGMGLFGLLFKGRKKL